MPWLIGAGTDSDLAGKHGDFGALLLTTHLEPGAQHLGAPTLGLDHEGLTGMADLEEHRAAEQFDAALALAEIDADGGVGIQHQLRVVRQGHLTDLPDRRHVVRAQVTQPVARMPAGTDTDHQQHRRRCGQPAELFAQPLPGRCRRPVHGPQPDLQGLILFLCKQRRRRLTALPQRLSVAVRLRVGRVGEQPALERGAVGQRRLTADPGQPVEGRLLLQGVG